MRNGKIAKLPYLVRNELNERMEKEEAGTALLTWLNAEPEVKKVLAEKFDGKEVSKQNLSDWRRGGFREWQLQREFKEAGTEMDPIRWDVDLPDLAENFLARMMGYYAVLMTGWDGRPDPEREARARVLRGLLRDGFLMQKWVTQVDKLKDELRERRRQRESIWDGGGGSLKEILAMAAKLRAEKNGESKADEGPGVNAETLRREDAKSDRLPEENATEQNAEAYEERAEVAPLLREAATEGRPEARKDAEAVPVESIEEAGAGMNDELPQKNTKEHEKASGVAKVGQGESCLAARLRREAMARQAGDGGKEAEGSGATEDETEGELPQENAKEHKNWPGWIPS